MGLFEGGQMLRSPDSPSIMMDCASGRERATRAIRCAWSSSTPYRSTGQALRTNPLGTCAGLSESAACENEPGVPVFFGWELGVAGVEIPSVVEPGGLGFGKVAADGLDVGGTLSRWKRTQMIDDRREPGLRAKCTEGIRGHGTMFREVCRLGSATGISRRVSSAGTPRSRATSSGAQPSDRSRP